MSRISAAASSNLQALIGNRCDTKVALAATGGATATIGSTGTITFTIGGVFATKAALAAQSLAPTHDWQGKPIGPAGSGASKYVQPVGTTVFYVVSLNSAGTVAVSQGSYLGQTYVHPTDPSRRERGTGDLPEEPDGYTAIGYVKITNGSVAGFDPGVTLLNVAGISQTYYDCERLPAVAP